MSDQLYMAMIEAKTYSRGDTSRVDMESVALLVARIEELEATNAAVEEENDLLRDVIQQKHARVEVQRLDMCKALTLPRDSDWAAVIEEARNAGIVRDAEYRWSDRVKEERDTAQARIAELEAQRADLLERCRQADRSKSLPELSTGEVRRALGIPLLGGPDA